MEDKITLDREAFKTLASKTRVDILKSLDRRRKMLTELSKQLGMSPSTVKEHMDQLAKAGLVVQIDDGHKWKYYELTPKAREIVHPTGTRVYVILGLSLFALMFTAWDMLRSGFQYAAPMAARGGDMLVQTGKESGDWAADASAQAVPAALPYVHILGIAVFMAIFGISLGYVIAKKARAPVLE